MYNHYLKAIMSTTCLKPSSSFCFSSEAETHSGQPLLASLQHSHHPASPKTGTPVHPSDLSSSITALENLPRLPKWVKSLNFRHS